MLAPGRSARAGEIRIEWTYDDADESNEIHSRITETGGDASYDVHVTGTKLLKPA